MFRFFTYTLYIDLGMLHPAKSDLCSQLEDSPGHLHCSVDRHHLNSRFPLERSMSCGLRSRCYNDSLPASPSSHRENSILWAWSQSLREKKV